MTPRADKERIKAGNSRLVQHSSKRFQSRWNRGNPDQTPILRRLALRAFELAGRRPWFALLTLRVVLAMTKSSPCSNKSSPLGAKRNENSRFLAFRKVTSLPFPTNFERLSESPLQSVFPEILVADCSRSGENL